MEQLSSVFELQQYIPTIQWKACGINEEGKFSIDVNEDNRGAYELAKAPKMRPRTKHVAGSLQTIQVSFNSRGEGGLKFVDRRFLFRLQILCI